MSKLRAIFDNGKKIGTCDDCGAFLRYEYATDDGKVYGSECIHRHIHNENWLTFKAKKDIELFVIRQKFTEKIYQAIISQNRQQLYHHFRMDNSGSFAGITFLSHEKYVAPIVLERLLTEGWTKEPYIFNGSVVGDNRYTTYLISPPKLA